MNSKALWLLCLVMACAVGGSAAAAPRPNILVIFTDDHGFADLGVQGIRKDVKTPHLDQLAADGIRFHRGYVSAPQCVPSRGGLLTGRYQTRIGLEQNPDAPLTLKEKTLADRLGAAGYVTGMVGKWHLDPSRQTTQWPDGKQPAGAYAPGKRGFQEYFNGTLRNFEASFDLAGNTLADAPNSVQDTRFRIDVQTDAALAFLKRRQGGGKPFFLYLAYFAPHVPLEKPPKYMARFADVPDETRQMGLAAISAVDDGVGRIRAYLREQGFDRSTLIFFIADNGAPVKPGSWDGSLNEPLVGEKGMLTDGGIRVPFLAAWPGTLPTGKVYEHPVISLDVAATATALAGQPKDPALDGVNLVPFLTGEKKGAPHDILYWRWRSQAAVLSGQWKLLLLGKDHTMLFDHASAAGETVNVADQHPEVVKQLKAMLTTWSATMNPPGLPQDIHQADAKFFVDHMKMTGLDAAPRGKPAPVGSVKDWLGRNCTLSVEGGALVVRGEDKSFITCSSLNDAAPVEFRLRVRSETGGRGTIQWRTAGSPDFEPGHAAAFQVAAGDWQDVKVPLTVAAGDRVIHVRIFLPAGEKPVSVKSIALHAAGGKEATRTWDFAK